MRIKCQRLSPKKHQGFAYGDDEVSFGLLPSVFLYPAELMPDKLQWFIRDLAEL